MLIGNNVAQAAPAIDRCNDIAMVFQILRDSVPDIRFVVANNNVRVAFKARPTATCRLQIGPSKSDMHIKWALF